MNQKLSRLRQIGREIETLSEESKTLRREIFEELSTMELPSKMENGWTFLLEDTLVTVKLSGKEHTVLFEDLFRIDSEET